MSVHDLARELMAARSGRQAIATPPSGRDEPFDLDSAYAVEAELVRQRQAGGRTTVGRKVGFANRAMWRVLKLDTLVWAHMYDDTVIFANGNSATLSLAPMFSPKIEPEIVFKMKSPISTGFSEPAAVLDSVEWLALGFEIELIFAHFGPRLEHIGDALAFRRARDHLGGDERGVHYVERFKRGAAADMLAQSRRSAGVVDGPGPLPALLLRAARLEHVGVDPIAFLADGTDNDLVLVGSRIAGAALFLCGVNGGLLRGGLGLRLCQEKPEEEGDEGNGGADHAGSLAGASSGSRTPTRVMRRRMLSR